MIHSEVPSVYSHNMGLSENFGTPYLNMLIVDVVSDVPTLAKSSPKMIFISELLPEAPLFYLKASNSYYNSSKSLFSILLLIPLLSISGISSKVVDNN